jgi:hypothetical protein
VRIDAVELRATGQDDEADRIMKLAGDLQPMGFDAVFHRRLRLGLAKCVRLSPRRSVGVVDPSVEPGVDSRPWTMLPPGPCWRESGDASRHHRSGRKLPRLHGDPGKGAVAGAEELVLDPPPFHRLGRKGSGHGKDATIQDREGRPGAEREPPGHHPGMVAAPVLEEEASVPLLTRSRIGPVHGPDLRIEFVHQPPEGLRDVGRPGGQSLINI